MKERQPPDALIWVRAVWRAQKFGDLGPLAQYLRHTDMAIKPFQRELLAVLFDRSRLAKKPWSKPLFEVPPEQQLKIAGDRFRELQRRAKELGLKVPRAELMKMAMRPYPRWFKGDHDTRFANYLDGKRGSTRRLAARRKNPPKKPKLGR